MSRHLTRLQAIFFGLIVCAGLGLALFFLFAASSRNGLDSHAFLVRGAFRDIGGVEVGTRVRIQGLDAGEVDSIEPPAQPGQPVVLHLRIAGRLRHLVRADARLQIAAENLLAGKIVRVIPGQAGAPPVEDDATLTADTFLDMTEGLAQATAKLNQVLGQIDTTLAEFRAGQGTTGAITRDLAQATAKLQTVLTKVDTTLDGVQKGEGTLGQLVKNDSLYRELDTVLSELRGALQEVRSGEGTLGKLVKNNEVYAEALGSLQDIRKMVQSVRQNSDAIKSLPLVRGYVIDPAKELIRPDCKRYCKWYPEDRLFEPGKAILTAEGKKLLDEAAPWLNQGKESGQDVVIAAFASPRHNPEFAQALTQKQSEAVMEYLKNSHRVQRTGFWAWSNRNVRALGVGNNPPPVPESADLPPARIELLVFVPQG